ncbi:hypothetical protein Btru_025583 [Bulinus truncatus]|nr:hypothetical protein Btru_025583 [Bulinus truncatus]
MFSANLRRFSATVFKDQITFIRVYNKAKCVRYFSTPSGHTELSNKWKVIAGIGLGLTVVTAGLKIQKLKASPTLTHSHAGISDQEEEEGNNELDVHIHNESEGYLFIYQKDCEKMYSGQSEILKIYKKDQNNVRTEINVIKDDGLKKYAIAWKNNTELLIKPIDEIKNAQLSELWLADKDNSEFIPLSQYIVLYGLSPYQEDSKRGRKKTTHYIKQGTADDADKDLKILAFDHNKSRDGRVLMGTTGNIGYISRPISSHPQCAPTWKINCKDRNRIKQGTADDAYKDLNILAFDYNKSRDGHVLSSHPPCAPTLEINCKHINRTSKVRYLEKPVQGQGGIDNVLEKPVQEQRGIDNILEKPVQEQRGIDNILEKPVQEQEGIDNILKKSVQEEEGNYDVWKKPVQEEKGNDNVLKKPVQEEEGNDNVLKKPVQEEEGNDNVLKKPVQEEKGIADVLRLKTQK